MKKLSVIIPTIQSKLKVLNKLLTIFEQDSVVDEIILINNAQNEFVPTVPIKKLKIHNQTKNLFVNPSWNLGIQLMRNDYFLIINDDILCPHNFCSLIMSGDVLDKEDTGLIGIYHWQMKFYDLNADDMDIPTYSNNSPVKFIPFDYYMGTGQWASAFWGNKKNYYQIPDELKIIFGDNYLLKQNLEAGKKNYFARNIIFNHISSSSTSKINLYDINNRTNNDFTFAKEYFGEDNFYELHSPPEDNIYKI